MFDALGMLALGELPGWHGTRIDIYSRDQGNVLQGGMDAIAQMDIITDVNIRESVLQTSEQFSSSQNEDIIQEDIVIIMPERKDIIQEDD